MIRTLIIDDEENNVKGLVALLERYCQEVEVVGTANSSQSGQQLISDMKPDLVFLDIEMPAGNGFDMLDSLDQVDFAIIFVTAFDNYAINAFRYSALDYLLKPVNIKNLQAAVQKVVIKLEEKTATQKVNNLLYNLKVGDTTQRKLALSSQDGLVFARLDTLVWLHASRNYTQIYLSNKQKIMVSKTLGDFENILPPESFSRVHHSYIVNHDFIKKYHQGRGGYLEMEDGFTIEVSSRKKEMFLSKFMR